MYLTQWISSPTSCGFFFSLFFALGGALGLLIGDVTIAVASVVGPFGSTLCVAGNLPLGYGLCLTLMIWLKRTKGWLFTNLYSFALSNTFLNASVI